MSDIRKSFIIPRPKSKSTSTPNQKENFNVVKSSSLGSFIQIDPPPLPSQDEVNAWISSTHEAGVRCNLYPHQVVAVEWWLRLEGLDKKSRAFLAGGILADDMGLGKTTTAITSTLLGRYVDRKLQTHENDSKEVKIHHPPLFPTLVVCPKGVVKQWEKEILSKTNLDQQDVLIYQNKHNSSNFKTELTKKIFVIVTYGTVRGAFARIVAARKGKTKVKGKEELLYTCSWDRIILDEAHIIRNMKANKTHSSICELRGRRRWCLSGTPFNNSSSDLAALAKFIGKPPFHDPSWWTDVPMATINAWKDVYVLMRKKEVVLNLPPPQVEILRVNLFERERALYDDLSSKAVTDFNNLSSAVSTEKSEVIRQLLVWLLRLRQSESDCTLHFGRSATLPFAKKAQASPNTIYTTCMNCSKDISKTIDRQFLKCKHAVCRDCGPSAECKVCTFANGKDSQETFYRDGNSSKTQALLTHLERVLSHDSTTKVVIFSQWTSYLDILEGALGRQFPTVDYVRLDGDINSNNKRDDIVSTFYKIPKCRLMLISLTAGGLGLNLTCANYVYMMDSWYNPFVEKQAIDRVNRLGQTKPVHVIKFHMNTSVDDAIDKIHARKLDESERCLEGKKGTKVGSSLNAQELNSVFSDMINTQKKSLSNNPTDYFETLLKGAYLDAPAFPSLVE